jgi:hypothetical protein
VTTSSADLPVKNPSRLVFDIGGKGFTRFYGMVGFENSAGEIGSTLNPQVRFFVFDGEPDPERVVPPVPGSPLPARPPLETVDAAIDHVFWSALGRSPSAEERRIAEAALRDPEHPGRPSPEGLADLLWAVMMKPEFQLIY